MQGQQRGEKEAVEAEAHVLSQMMSCESATRVLYGVLPQDVVRLAVAVQSSLAASAPLRVRRQAKVELEVVASFVLLVAKACHHFS